MGTFGYDNTLMSTKFYNLVGLAIIYVPAVPVAVYYSYQYYQAFYIDADIDRCRLIQAELMAVLIVNIFIGGMIRHRQNMVKLTSTIASKKIDIKIFQPFKRHFPNRFIGFDAIL